MDSSKIRKLILNPIKLINRLMASPLVKNAGYIFLGLNFIPSIFGFLYWVFSSRFYQASDVGIAAAFISAISLVSLLSSFGTNIGIIRFIPISPNPNRLINSVLNLNIIASLVLVIVFFLGLPVWGKSIREVFTDPLAIFLFTLTVILSTLGTTVRDGLIGFQNSKLASIYMLVFNLLRVCFVILGIKYRNLGLIGSLTLAYVFANVLGILFLLPKSSLDFSRSFRIDWDDVKHLLPFSGANYVATIVLNLPSTFLPILTLAILGPESNAYFYMVMMMGMMIASPGIALALSAFAQGSHEYSASGSLLRRAIIVSLGVTCLVSLISVSVGRWLLSIFGIQYAIEGIKLFYLLALTAPVSVMNQMLITYLRLRMLNMQLISMNLILAIISILGAWILLPKMGINGNGISLLLGNLIAFFFGIISLKIGGSPNAKKILEN